jgi:septum formation protein
MQAAGMSFRVVRPSVDETRRRHLPPVRQARTLAREKAMEVAAREPGALVVGCDTVVAVDGEALGQPVDAADASRMLRRLAGRTHSVITAVCLVAPAGEGRGDHAPGRRADGDAGRGGARRQAEGVAISRVRMAPLGDREIEDYVAGGEPFGKAGAYAIQGGAGEFTALTRGRSDTVIGLPMHLLRRLLRELGHTGRSSAGPV